MAAVIGGGFKAEFAQLPNDIKNGLNVPFFQYTNGSNAIAFLIKNSYYFVYDFIKEQGVVCRGTVKKIRSTTYLELSAYKSDIINISVSDFVSKANNDEILTNISSSGDSFIAGTSNFFMDNPLKNISGMGIASFN